MWNSSWPKSAGKYNCIQRISHLTCKTYSLKALINFFCWHPIFWRRSSLIESHGTELFFFVCGRLSQFRTDFHRSIYILSRTATYLHFFDLLNICALEYLCSSFFFGHQYCMRARHISLCRETIRAPSFCVCKLYYNFYKSPRAYFPQNIFLQVISFSD